MAESATSMNEATDHSRATIGAAATVDGVSLRARAARRFWRRRDARLCAAVVAAYALVALGATITRHRALRADRTPDYQSADLARAYLPPGRWAHPLGTDGLGRDIAGRLAQGARIAFLVGIVTSLIAIPIGLTLGLCAGYFGGRVDDAVVWLDSTIASVPGLLFILAIALIVGKGLVGVCLGIGLTTWVSLCRLIRAETLRHRELEYVQAARALGAGHGRILWRHILPNVVHIVIITFTLRFPAAVGTEVFLSFLGIGVQGEPSWGSMIASGRLRLWQGAWWELTFVTAAIFGLVLAFNLLGDALRDALDPRAA